MYRYGYGYINHYLTVYNNEYCNYPSSQVHEIGHNLGLGHSGDGGGEYGDLSGIMGLSYSVDEGPWFCFNPAKSWSLGWYNDRHAMADPLTQDYWSGKLVGVSDYSETDGRWIHSLTHYP